MQILFGYLNDTCEPSRHGGPNPVPKKEHDHGVRTAVRYLRWFLESSYTSLKGRRPTIIAQVVWG
jgi:hypothetical protein